MRLSLFSSLLFFSCLVFSQSKETVKIGLLSNIKDADSKVIFQRIIQETKAVVGEDALIVFSEEHFLYHGNNIENARKNYQQLVSSDVDVILAFDPINALVINEQKAYSKPTILFAAITEELSPLDFKKQSSGIENFTFLVASQSFTEDIKTLKEITSFKKLGIAIEKPMTIATNIEAILDKVAKEQDINYTLIPFSNAADIASNLTDIDALYLAGGFSLLDEEIKALAQTLIERKIPSLTATSVKDVTNGLMATNIPEETLEQFIRRVALTIEGFVNGTPLSEMPVYIDFDKRLTLNFNTAEKLDIPLKFSLMAQTDFKGELTNSKAEEKYDLLQVINKTLSENLNLRANQKDVLLSEQDAKLAKSNYLPSITASASGKHNDPDASFVTNPEFSTAGNINLQQTVFSETSNANISIQKQLKLAEEQNYKATSLDAVYDAANAYFNALISKVNVGVQNQNLELTKKNLRVAKQNYEAGQAGKSDMLRFKSQMAQNSQTLIEAINQLEASYISLNQIMNQDVDTEIEVADASLGKGVFEAYNYNQMADLLDNPKLRKPFTAFLIEESKNNAPELKSLDFNVKAIERNIRLNSFGRFLPTVALEGNYNHVFNQWGIGANVPDQRGSYNIGASISIPILNRNQTNINKRTAIIQKEQLLLNKENVSLSLESNIQNGVLALINQTTNIELSKISEDAAKESYELTEVAYANGAVTIIELLDSQSNYLQAQLNSANAVYNFLLNSIQLERIIGYNFLLHSADENAAFQERFSNFLNTYPNN